MGNIEKEKHKLIDVRNTVRKNIRFRMAMKGHAAASTLQKKYITWYRFGFDNRHLTSMELIDLFHQQWEEVSKHNMDVYGVEDPWSITGGTYHSVEKV